MVKSLFLKCIINIVKYYIKNDYANIYFITLFTHIYKNNHIMFYLNEMCGMCYVILKIMQY